MSAQEHPIYRFADCELDVRDRCLRVRGRSVVLAPKVFDMLALLVEHAGQVVGHDLLMATLWPRGDVPAANLDRHAARIRQALGGDAADGCCIESVPDAGFRLLAPVQRVDAAAAAGLPPAADATHARVPAHAEARRRPAGAGAGRRRNVAAAAAAPDARPARPHLPSIRLADQLRLLAIAVVLLLLLGGEYWWSHARAPAHPAFIADPGALAVVELNNLSGDAHDAWLGSALARMLATELDTGNLHALSAQRVRAARIGLPMPGKSGYPPADLATLQQRLGAHYVLSGGYIVSGTAAAPQLRVDVTLQDGGADAPVATTSRAAPLGDLPTLLASLGADLRKQLGQAPAAATTLAQIAAAQPPNAAVARHVGLALDALDQHAAAHARDELLQATALAPTYAPAYFDLSRAWATLGEHAKAVAAATQAAHASNPLSRVRQLQIDAQQAALDGDAARVIALRSDLVQMRPDDPDLRLQWIDTLIVAARHDAASRALAQAHALPAFAGDPRLELAQARLAARRGDHAAMLLHARQALAQARVRGAPDLVAEAALQSGIALQDDPTAEPLLRDAISGFDRTGNPQGEARAWQHLARLQGWRGQSAAARASDQKALALYQGIDDRDGEMTIAADLSQAAWQAGDRDGAAAALRSMLATARAAGDTRRQGWALTALATVTADDSASDAADQLYRQAIELDAQAGAHAQLAFAQASYADFLRMRGQLGQARAACSAAQAAEARVAPDERSLGADFQCAHITLEQGKVDVADAELRTIVTRALAAKDGFAAANARALLGRIAMGRGQWIDARAALQQALDGWTSLREIPGQATTAALLAVCARALHDTTARDQLAAQARQLRSHVTARAEVFELDVALAELQGLDGPSGPSLATLQKLAADATQRQWPGLAFEARLAALRVLEHGADHAVATARAHLVADAQHAGFGWVAQRAALAAPTAHVPARTHDTAGDAHPLD